MNKADAAADSLTTHSGKIISVIVCGLLAVVAFLSLGEVLDVSNAGIVPALPMLVMIGLVAVAWKARTSDHAAFFASSRQMPPLAAALAALPLWLPAGSFLMLAGGLYRLGFDGLAFVIGPVAGLILGAMLFTPYLGQSKSETIGQFIGLRFGRLAQGLVAVIAGTACVTVCAASLHSAAFAGALIFSVPIGFALVMATALVAVFVLPGGHHGANWTGMAAATVALVAIAVSGAVIGAQYPSLPSAQLAATDAIPAITNLEYAMVENGVAAAASLKPYAKPFVHFGSDMFFLVLVTLCLVTATLPMVLQRSLALPSRETSRSSSLWLVALAIYIGLSAVAWAALSKTAVYRTIGPQLAFSQLPPWMERLSETGALKIHGVSVALLKRVTEAVGEGVKDAAGVEAILRTSQPAHATVWASLKDPIKVAMISVAEAEFGSATLAPSYRWDSFKDVILPIAAKANANKSGALKLSSLVFEPQALIAELPAISGVPLAVISLALAGLLALPLAVAGAAAATAGSSLNRDLLESTFGARRVAGLEPGGSRAIMGVSLVIAFAVAAMEVNVAGLTAFALVLTSAVLFPVLTTAIWWRRANGYGAVAGVVTAVVIVTYLGFDAAFGRTGIFESFEGLAKQGVLVFSVPVSLLAIMIVSLATPAPGPDSQALVTTARGEPESLNSHLEIA